MPFLLSRTRVNLSVGRFAGFCFQYSSSTSLESLGHFHSSADADDRAEGSKQKAVGRIMQRLSSLAAGAEMGCRYLSNPTDQSQA